MTPDRFFRVDHPWGEVLILFHCPGCGYDHPFRVEGTAPVWGWNGDMVLGTFSPSLLCNQSHPASRCHSFVRDGRIQFLGDCWHNLKGQTVDVPPWEGGEVAP